MMAPLLPLPDAVRELEVMSTPQLRFVYLVERARQRPPLPIDYRTDSHRVTGCQVRTWWVGEVRLDRCWFGLDSDAITVKALGGFLCEQACELPLTLQQTYYERDLERWGVLRQVAENRRATLIRIACQIRTFAAAISTT